ncbi:MAG TPA: hypothetical protein VMU30_02105 [Bacteroidota bacterium]|nr:hypothetical protein [Bacteroidota bacterium]
MNIEARLRNGISIQERIADLVLNCEINEALINFIEQFHYKKMDIISWCPFACDVIDKPRFLCCIDFEVDEHLNLYAICIIQKFRLHFYRLFALFSEFRHISGTQERQFLR